MGSPEFTFQDGIEIDEALYEATVTDLDAAREIGDTTEEADCDRILLELIRSNPDAFFPELDQTA